MPAGDRLQLTIGKGDDRTHKGEKVRALQREVRPQIKVVRVFRILDDEYKQYKQVPF